MNTTTTAQTARDTAAKNVTLADTNLAAARAELIEIKAIVAELDLAYDSDEELPKNHQSKVDQAQGRLIQLTRAVARRETAVTEAQAILTQADEALTEENLVNLAETLTDFDKDAWVEKVHALIQPVIDEHLPELHQLEQTYLDLDRAIRADGRDKHPRDQHAGRVGKTQNFYKDPTLDGQTILPPSSKAVLDGLREAIVDTVKAKAEAEARAEAHAERVAEQARQAAEAKAWRDAAAIAKWGKADPSLTPSRDKHGKEYTMTARSGLGQGVTPV